MLHASRDGEIIGRMSENAAMDDKPKRKQPPGGSRLGRPNKATANAREAIARFVDGNVDRLQGWLDEIAEQEGPLAAWRCVTDVLEYHVPKLARTEHVGDGGGPVRIVATTDDQNL